MSAPLPTKVKGPSVLLMGMEGTGKTDSVRTLLEAGLNVFVVFSEPGMEVLLDPSRGRKVYTCHDGLHYRYIPVATPNWDDLRTAADHLNKFSFKALANEAATGRERYRAFYEIVDCMGNLKCQRCNQSFGPADRLEPYHKWAVVNDSLTSISKAALYLHIGNKPAVDKGEYGICMFNIERYLDKFVGDIHSMTVMMAHVDMEPNENTGGTENMVATLGQKLAPKVGRPFSDVILAKRRGSTFSWSTTEERYRLKTRNFAFASDIPPTFVPVVQKWHQRIRDEEAAREASNATQAAVTK